VAPKHFPFLIIHIKLAVLPFSRAKENMLPGHPECLMRATFGRNTSSLAKLDRAGEKKLL